MTPTGTMTSWHHIPYDIKCVICNELIVSTHADLVVKTQEDEIGIRGAQLLSYRLIGGFVAVIPEMRSRALRTVIAMKDGFDFVKHYDPMRHYSLMSLRAIERTLLSDELMFSIKQRDHETRWQAWFRYEAELEI